MPSSLTQATFDPSRRLVLLGQFESMVGEVVRLRTRGSDGVTIARAQGAADGFAQALITSGFASDAELLQAAQAARRGGAGPATRTVDMGEGTARSIDAGRTARSSDAVARVVA